MKKDETAAFLKETELFEDLSGGDRDALCPLCREKTFSRGTVLFREHESLGDIILIISGSIQVFKPMADGTERSVTIFSEREFLNEAVLIDREKKQNVSARVYQDARVLLIRPSALLAFFEERGRAAVTVYSRIAEIIARRMEHASYRRENVSSLYRERGVRREHDLLGEKDVPYSAYYGIQTLRAMENFDISGVVGNFYPHMISSLAMVKKASAQANFDLGLLDRPVKDAIVQACDEISHGMLHNHFIVDMIQGGAGTSVNMNANEVIANRALEILGRGKGDYSVCHPNNHVNLSQSTNDAYPTAIKIALVKGNESLVTVLNNLIGAFENKALEFRDIIKMGRTQLQDAVPMTLGQTFQAYASNLKHEVYRLRESASLFLSVNMGGTAIGTGINTAPQYRQLVMTYLRRAANLDVFLAGDLIEATNDTGDFVMYSSVLKRVAVKLSKICNDLRLLSSGPRAGLNEINLPPMQPGSSIMPGKVNPVIPEVVNQVAFKVIGSDLTVTLAAEAGQLELNVMEPVIVESLFSSVEMLKNGMATLTERCVKGITANRDICRGYVENSIGLVTALNPRLGYEISSSLAREALESGRSVGSLVMERKLMTREELDELLAPENMIQY